MQKKSLLLLLLVGLVIISSCRRTRWEEFKINYTSEIFVPGTLGVNTSFAIPGPDITTESEEQFEINKTKSRWVGNIQLEEMNLKILTPANRDFKFLKSIEIYISSEGNGEQLLASRMDIPEDIGRELELYSSGSNFVTHIKAEKFTLRVVKVTRQFFSQDITIQADKVFIVRNDNRLF
jgi:hypothetical protein